MGLGKTIQAIASISINPAKTVIIVPASVVYNWKDEINRFARELKPFIYEGKNKKDLLKKMDKFTIIIVSYDTFQRDAESFYKDNWGWIILDEAQKIKNPTTRRSKAIFKLEGEKRVALSGTPIENHLGELWSLFHFLDPILLGENKNFNNIFVKPILNDDKSRKILLKNILSTFLLRRLKKDVLKELPDKTEITHWVNFNSDEKTYYEALRREALKDLKGNKDSKGVQRIKILAHLTKLRQASCDISLAGEKISKSSKTEEAIKLIRNILESKHKTLVFSQFTSYFKLFKKELDNNNIKYLYLDGSTPKKKRAQLVKRFESNNESVFLISLKAGGTGLNLTSANYVIHLDPWWNPAVEDQATDRTHRIGQSKNVIVYKMIVKNSIEEKIIALHKSKKELSNSILDNMDKPQNKLSIDDLMKMLKS
jgi:SNF2 family DNA or RNA helicase